MQRKGRLGQIRGWAGVHEAEEEEEHLTQGEQPVRRRKAEKALGILSLEKNLVW